MPPSLLPSPFERIIFDASATKQTRGASMKRKFSGFRALHGAINAEEFTPRKGWSSDRRRRAAVGRLRRLSATSDAGLLKAVAFIAVRLHLPAILRARAARQPNERVRERMLAAAHRCFMEGTWQAARDARKGARSTSDVGCASINAACVAKVADSPKKFSPRHVSDAIENAAFVARLAAENSADHDGTLSRYVSNVVRLVSPAGFHR
jgi:hypothetical protein